MKYVWKLLRLLWSTWAVVWAASILLFFSCLVIVLQLMGFSEKVISVVGRVWAKLTAFGAGVKIKVIGLDALDHDEAYVFAGNHASAADIPILQAILPPNFRWIAKEELFSVPIFGAALRAAGYIPINRSSGREAMRSLQKAATRIATGASVVVFPEGTRTSDGELLPFKSGGLLLAIKSNRPVVPFYIHGSRKVLQPKRYYVTPGTVYVYMGRPLETEELKTADRDDLAERTRERVVELRQRAINEHPEQLFAGDGQG